MRSTNSPILEMSIDYLKENAYQEKLLREILSFYPDNNLPDEFPTTGPVNELFEKCGKSMRKTTTLHRIAQQIYEPTFEEWSTGGKIIGEID